MSFLKKCVSRLSLSVLAFGIVTTAHAEVIKGSLFWTFTQIKNNKAETINRGITFFNTKFEQIKYLPFDFSLLGWSDRLEKFETIIQQYNNMLDKQVLLETPQIVKGACDFSLPRFFYEDQKNKQLPECAALVDGAPKCKIVFGVNPIEPNNLQTKKCSFDESCFDCPIRSGFCRQNFIYTETTCDWKSGLHRIYTSYNNLTTTTSHMILHKTMINNLKIYLNKMIDPEAVKKLEEIKAKEVNTWNPWHTLKIATYIIVPLATAAIAGYLLGSRR